MLLTFIGSDSILHGQSTAMVALVYRNSRIARRLKLAGLMLASTWTGFMAYYTGAFTGGNSPVGGPSAALMTVMFAIAIASCIVAWWRPRLAAILSLVVFGVIVVYIPSIGLERMWAVFVSLVPFLVAGVLWLISWHLSSAKIENLTQTSSG
jgi:hypothetical protein